jgi:hypothetical protein
LDYQKLNFQPWAKVHENRGISKRMKIKIKATGTLTGLPYRARSTNLTFVSWLFSTNEIN